MLPSPLHASAHRVLPATLWRSLWVAPILQMRKLKVTEVKWLATVLVLLEAESGFALSSPDPKLSTLCYSPCLLLPMTEQGCQGN